MIILTIAAQKGGAGKTTLAAHLGVQAAKSGRRVLLADLDPQQSLAKWRRRREGFDLHLACMPPLADLTAQASAEGYQMVIIDTPPRAAANTLAAIGAASLVLVPMQPTILDVDAMDTMTEVLDAARARGRAHVVLNRCPPSRGNGQPVASVADAGRAVADGYKLALCPIFVGQRSVYAAAMNDGRAVTEVEPDGKAAAEMTSLFTFILEHAQ